MEGEGCWPVTASLYESKQRSAAFSELAGSKFDLASLFLTGVA